VEKVASLRKQGYVSISKAAEMLGCSYTVVNSKALKTEFADLFVEAESSRFMIKQEDLPRLGIPLQPEGEQLEEARKLSYG